MDIIEYCRSKGIKREYSIARTPQQNGVAERTNRTLIEPITTKNKANKTVETNSTTGLKETNNSAGTQDSFDAKNFEMEADHAQEYYVLPLWSSYTSTVKSSKAKNGDEKLNDDTDSKTNEEPIQKVWILVDLPFGKKAIGRKWVYKNKNDERAVVVRNKARLVAQGHRQEEGIYYDEVFAPVARIEAIRIFLAFASYMRFVVHQMDVKSAFLYGKINDDVYVSQPLYFIDPKFPNKDKKDIMLVQVFVDDIILGSKKKSWCDEFDSLMKNSVKTVSTPIETKKPLVKDEEAVDVDVHLYRSMIGPLMYLTASRPNFMYAVYACSRFHVTTKTSHLQAVKRIFRYLKGQPKLGLWYPRESAFDLEAYSNSDYAGANLDRKSTTGGYQFLGRRLISWQCKKQTIIATSTTEAEYVAAASCCGQVLWIQNQMLDYGFKFINTKIYIDNESTICIVKNPVFHSKTKHIKIRHHFITDAYEKKLIYVLKIHNDDNVADLLTKAFDGKRQLLKDNAARLKLTTARVYVAEVEYALTATPTIYASCIKQFWTSAKVKTVNDEVRIQALVDGKRVNIKESSIRCTLRLDDAEGSSKRQRKAVLIEEPKPLKRKVQIKLDEEVARHLEAELNADINWNAVIEQVKRNERLNDVLSMMDVNEEESTDVEEVLEVVKVAKLMTKVVTTVGATKVSIPRKRRGVIIQDPKEITTTTVQPKVQAKDKGKAILIEEPKPLKRKAQIKLDEEVARHLEAELNADINWNVVIEQVKRNERLNDVVMKYQTLKRKPLTQA
nr:hypothetical protein [Tanacetum cinerariifolium]